MDTPSNLITHAAGSTLLSWRQPGALVLVSCYELGHQPSGLAQPLASLQAAGYAPTAVDIAVDELEPGLIRHARFIGISVPMHTALRLGVRVAERIRALNPSCHLCFYGLYASLNAGYLLDAGSGRLADSVIGGEYDQPLVRLMRDLEGAAGRDEADAELVGVSLPDRVVKPLLQRVPADVPVPSRAGLRPLTRYVKLARDGREHTVGSVEASRGCLHRCLHCPIVPVYEGRFFVIPESVVLADIRQQVEAGATHITFSDPDFLNGPGHSMAIVRAMHAEFPALTFDFTAKVEHLLKRRALLPELADVGCLFVVSAVESFSDVVLARLQKGHTRADALTVLQSLRHAGLTLRPSLVAFTPWTTLEDYLEMFEAIEGSDLIDSVDPVQYAVRLLIPPGSALLARREPGSVHAFVGPLDQAGFQYPWVHPDPRMDRLQEAVAAAVEEAARHGEEPEETFQTVRGLALRMAGRHPAARPAAPRIRPRPPRLTESWFCCAEPTKSQIGAVTRPGSCDEPSCPQDR